MNKFVGIIFCVLVSYVLVSGCIDGAQLVGQSEPIPINGLWYEFTTQKNNLTIDTSAEMVNEGLLNKRIIVTGNVTNHGTISLPVVTIKSSFYSSKGTSIVSVNNAAISENIYLLDAGDTRYFEMVYEVEIPDNMVFDMFKTYKIEVFT